LFRGHRFRGGANLLDILTRTAHLVGWHHHFGPASGSYPKIKEALARYVLTVFPHGTLLGPAQLAAHMRSKVSVHELTLAGNRHTTGSKIEKASATVINAFSKLDVASIWGDGKTTAAADGSQIDTWENNLRAETSIGCGGYGGIANRHVSSTYVALFSHFIPCGVWGAPVRMHRLGQAPWGRSRGKRGMLVAQPGRLRVAWAIIGRPAASYMCCW